VDRIVIFWVWHVNQRPVHIALTRNIIGNVLRYRIDIYRISRWVTLIIHLRVIGGFSRAACKSTMLVKFIFNSSLNFCTLGSVVILDLLPFIVDLINMSLICGGSIPRSGQSRFVAIRNRRYFLLDAGKASLSFLS